MPNFQILNNVEHGSLKVITDRGAEYGDSVMFAMTFPQEMRKVQGCYPIIIHKDNNNGKYYPVALFGFEERENLFLEGNNWNAPYIPMLIQRQPFMIGLQKSNPAADAQRVMTIDMDNPRVSTTSGIDLFREHGGNSEYLDSVAGMLETIHNGQEQNDLFMEALLQHELVESMTLKIRLDDGSENQLQGFYMLDDEKLQTLEEAAVLDLHRRGFLLPAFMVVASQSQISTLVDLRNARLSR